MHGQFSPKITRNLLQHFHADYEAALQGVDPTLTLSGMYELTIVNQRSEQQLRAAVEICPTAAIEGEPGRRRVIDEACIRCGACLEVAPDAMAKQARTARPGLVPLG